MITRGFLLPGLMAILIPGFVQKDWAGGRTSNTYLDMTTTSARKQMVVWKLHAMFDKPRRVCIIEGWNPPREPVGLDAEIGTY